MSLRDEIQADIAEAFDEDLADAVYQFSCTKAIHSNEYDFATQSYPIERYETYNGRGVLFGSYAKDMVKPTGYQAEDAKATILQSEVSAVPQIDDEWLTVKGIFKVMDVGADPADVTWVVRLRKVTDIQ